MRIVLPTRKVSVCVSLLVQYSLILTLASLPVYRSTVRAQSKFPSSKSSLATVGSTQDLVRPTPTPPVPGIGSGGTGPDGSFNVEPPARLEGPPPGVRSADEVLNETRMQPTIPDPVPSTEGYCWPGDPACRKRATIPLPRPTPKPTPPPRPQQASVLAQRANLLVAINGFYTEKLLKSPQLSRFWNSEPYSATTDFGRLFRSSALGSPNNAAAASRSMSYLSADCSNAQGIASNAQLTVYVYVDGVNVGTTSIEWDESFIYDISAYVNDGANHDISAWYYDWSWSWVEAGSTSVSGCLPNYDFNMTLQYDVAGNRTSMSSSASTATYTYDTASRLTSEARTFSGLAGSFTLSYAYNQLGQLKELTNPWNAKVGYTYNHAGELTGVTGQGYAGVTNYASGMTYRAFGGLKQMNYANGRTLFIAV